MDPLEQLHDAVEQGHGVVAALAAGAAVNVELGGFTALHRACRAGSAECVRLLLAAGADPELRDAYGQCVIHWAAFGGHTECIVALLEANADPLAKLIHGDFAGGNALHIAVWFGHLPAVRLLFQAAPQAALAQDRNSQTPLTLALSDRKMPPANQMGIARYLLEAALIAADEIDRLLAALRRAGVWALLLYPALVARQPLTATQWAALPLPCFRLGVALPAVLQRSEAEAGQLVRRLPETYQEHLRTLALCLGVTARRGLLPPLPADIERQLLARAVQQLTQDDIHRHESSVAAQQQAQRARLQAQQEAQRQPEAEAPWWHDLLIVLGYPGSFYIISLALALHAIEQMRH